MLIALLILQAATLGVLVYVILQIKTIFREVRNPVVRQKGQLSADFKDRLRNLPRPEGQNRDNREGNRENRDNRGDRPNREGNRDNRDNRGDRPNRDGNRDTRGDRGPRPEGNRENRDNRGDRPNRDGNRDNRGDRGPRPEGNRENRDNRDRGDRAPRAEAPVAEAAAEAAPAPVFQGRRPLTPAAAAPSSSDSAVDATPDALAPSSLAQPVADAPIRHGRRALPKAKPRFDDEDDSTSEAKTESAAV